MVLARVVDDTVRDLRAHLQAGDIIIGCGNSHYVDDLRRSKKVAESALPWVDIGTSGGVHELDGYCLMIGIYQAGCHSAVASELEGKTPRVHIRSVLPWLPAGGGHLFL